MSGSKNSVRKWKVLDHVDSDDVLFAFAPKRPVSIPEHHTPPLTNLTRETSSQYYG